MVLWVMEHYLTTDPVLSPGWMPPCAICDRHYCKQETFFFIVVATGLPELFATAGGGKAQFVASVLLE